MGEPRTLSSPVRGGLNWFYEGLIRQRREYLGSSSRSLWKMRDGWLGSCNDFRGGAWMVWEVGIEIAMTDACRDI